METKIGDCDFCQSGNVLVVAGHSYGEDPIGFCLECAKEFVSAQPSMQADECPVCHGAKTIVKNGNTEDCATCGATGIAADAIR